MNDTFSRIAGVELRFDGIWTPSVAPDGLYHFTIMEPGAAYGASFMVEYLCELRTKTQYVIKQFEDGRN